MNETSKEAMQALEAHLYEKKGVDRWNLPVDSMAV